MRGGKKEEGLPSQVRLRELGKLLAGGVLRVWDFGLYRGFLGILRRLSDLGLRVGEKHWYML